MKILNRYIFESLVRYIFLSLLFYISVDLFFSLINESRLITLKPNNIKEILINSALTSASKVYVLFSWSIPSGILFFLNIIKENNEFIAMKSLSISINDFKYLILKSIILIIIFILTLGDIIIPFTKSYIKENQKNNKNIQFTYDNIPKWNKYNNTFSNFNITDNKITSFSIYIFNERGILKELLYSRDISLKKKYWKLKKTQLTKIHLHKVKSKIFNNIKIKKLRSYDTVKEINNHLERETYVYLYNKIKTKDKNNTALIKYKLAFLQKICQPFIFFLMAYIATIYAVNSRQNMRTNIIKIIIMSSALTILNNSIIPIYIKLKYIPIITAAFPVLLTIAICTKIKTEK